MRTRTLAFTLLLALISFLRDSFFQEPSLLVDSRQLHELNRNGNSETRLALGEKISLKRAEVFDLQLISGIGDTLAESIIERRDEIISEAAVSGVARRESVFEIVHGIGPKRSKFLSSKIDPLL